MDHTDPARQLAPPPLGWFPDDPLAAGRRNRWRREAAAERRFLQPQEPTPNTVPERWRLTIRGKVQGVGYREACCRCAHDLGLSGWVRNLPDGTVEVEAEGRPQDLTALVMWCERGPQPARVIGVHSRRIAPAGDDWFEIRR
jgi:acylphosphatase